jgi:hypothetical protein
MWVVGTFSVIGLLLLAFGLHESWTRRRIAAYGVRVMGYVVGHVPHPEDPSAGPYAVISYPGEEKMLTYTSSMSTTADWPVGMPVRIGYLPGKPGSTRIDHPRDEPPEDHRFLLILSLALMVLPPLLWLLFA